MSIKNILYIIFFIITIVVILNYIIMYYSFKKQYHILLKDLIKIEDKYYIENQDNIVKEFNENGAFLLPNVLSNSDCDELLNIISKFEFKKNNETGDLKSMYKRKDLMLPLEVTEKYIKKIYDKIRHFCDKVVPEAKLIEISSFITYPGCFPQIWHTDHAYSDYEDNATIITFGIALDDITENMGPLEVFLGSNHIWENTNELYDKYNIKDDLLNNVTTDEDDIKDGLKEQSLEQICNILKFKHKKFTCKKGSLIAWSTRVCHRGGGNDYKRRPVFYFSLMGKGKCPDDTVYSIFKKGKHTYIKYDSID